MIRFELYPSRRSTASDWINPSYHPFSTFLLRRRVLGLLESSKLLLRNHQIYFWRRLGIHREVPPSTHLFVFSKEGSQRSLLSGRAHVLGSYLRSLVQGFHSQTVMRALYSSGSWALNKTLRNRSACSRMGLLFSLSCLSVTALRARLACLLVCGSQSFVPIHLRSLPSMLHLSFLSSIFRCWK